MTLQQKKIILLICTAVIGFGIVGCSRVKEPIKKSGFYFDTVISVTLYDDKDEKLLDGCFALADKYEGYFSTTLPDSDIAKINAANGSPVSVHDETITLLKEGLRYSKLSGGGFDITIGALSTLWDFKNNKGVLPEEQSIKDAVSTIDYHHVVIDESNKEVTLGNPKTQIDLGAIAKGYIADRMKDYLNENGVTSGLINLGGNVLSVGPKDDGSAYSIGIQKPFSKEGTPLGAIEIKDKTVVSSGVYERNFTVEDKLYHHLLNPKTGYPYENGLTGVTIICKKSVDGDGLSTTCFSLGLEEGMKLIESLEDTEAIFITDDKELHFSSGIGDTVPFQRVDE